MDNLLIILLNTAIVILAIAASVISIYKTRMILRGEIAVGWWIVLPFALISSVVNRTFVLMGNLDILPDEYVPWVPAFQIIFWSGMVIFLYGFYKVTKELIRRCE